MELSLIIVNYNTRPFLEQCLAALAATTTLPHEIIIVDNHSPDDSAPGCTPEPPPPPGDLQLGKPGLRGGL